MTTTAGHGGVSAAAERPVVNLDVRVVEAPGFATVIVTCDEVETTGVTPYTVPVTAEQLAAYEDALALAQARARTESRHVGPRTPTSTRDARELEETLGHALFDAVFRSQTLKVLVQARQEAEDRGAFLRIRLQLDSAPSAAGLPWELMLDGQQYLAQSTERFVVRFADRSDPPRRAAREGALRVLVVAAAPSDLPSLALDAELASLVAGLAPLGDDVVVQRLDPPTQDALHDALVQDWHVLHFIGHGDVREGGNVVALEAADGTADLVDARTLGSVLASAPRLRLAVLNGCSTGQVSEREPQGGVAYQLVQGGIGAAVAMQFPITDGGAIAFAAALYERLAAGALVDQAVAFARGKLLGGPEWVTPVLYAGTDARLFDPPPAPPAAAAPRLSVADRVPLGVVPAADRFQPRGWVAREVADWQASDSPLLLLTGDHGTGKTVLGAWLAGRGDPPADPPEAAALAQVRGRWSAAHLRAASLAGAPLDPRAFVRAVAEQLAVSVPGWSGGAAVETAGGAVEDLAVELLERPLTAALSAPGSAPALLLVDGLDEAGEGPEPTVLMLVRRLLALPVPVRMLLAGPDDPELLRPFEGVGDLRRIDLSRAGRREEVDRDVRAYLGRRLAAAVPADVVDRVVTAAAGNFLYARYAADELVASPDLATADLVLPRDLDDAHERHVRTVLERAYGEAWRDEWAARVEPLLGQLAVARAPVPRAALAHRLGVPPTTVADVLGEVQALVVTDEQGSRLTHPSLAAMLRRATLSSGRVNDFQVDVPGAHRRVVESAVRLTDAELVRPADVGGTYELVHAPGHLAELVAGGGDDALVGQLTARVLTAAWATGLAGHVTDPVLVGLPYRELVGVLLARRDTAHVEELVRFLASTDVPVLRGAVFDVLERYAAHDPQAAQRFLVRLVLDEGTELQAIALHATCLLTASLQAVAFREVLTARAEAGAGSGPVAALRRLTRRARAGVDDDEEARGDELASAAAFALYANGTADPQRLIAEVLDQVLEGLSLTQPRRARALIGFFGQVTVTNYVNGCSDPAVTRLTSDLWRRLLVDRMHLRTLNRGLVEKAFVEPVIVHQLSLRIQDLFTPPGADEAVIGPDVPGADAAGRVVRALDPAVDVVPLEADLRALLGSDVALFRILAAMTLGVHGIAHPEPTEALVRRLLPGLDGRGLRWLLLSHAVVLPETPPSWVPLLEEVTAAVVAREHDDADEPGPLLGLHLAFVPLGLAYAKAGLPMQVHARVLREGGAHGAHGECCLLGLGAVGLHHPGTVLAALGGFVDEHLIALPDAVPALALVAGVHPLLTRRWLLERDARGVLDEVWGRLDVGASRDVLELLGMYNNGVHQSVHYPRMRERLCATVFTHFIEARSSREWAQLWTRDGLGMLRDSEYELIRWTT